MTEFCSACLRKSVRDASETGHNCKTRGGMRVLGSIFLMEGSLTGLAETVKSTSLAIVQLGHVTLHKRA